MSADDDDLGGGVDLTMLDRVVNRDAGRLPTADSGEASAILKPLARFLSGCVAQFGRLQDCTFLFAVDPERDFGLLARGRRHPHLVRPRGRPYSPSGRLHMVAAGGHRAASAAAEEDLSGWLRANGLRHRPLAWYRSAEHVLVWYPRGLAEPALAIEIPVGNPGTVDVATVDAALAIFYDKRCRVPDAAIPFWHDATSRVPRRLAEKDIQRSLLQTLEAVFHRCRVEREVPLTTSEVDFAIFGPHAGRQAALCVIEVKVLRHMRYNAEPKEANRCPEHVNRRSLVDGVAQAAFARDELTAPLAFLAAYDMRATDDDGIMGAVAEASATTGVECRRFFLFNSKAAYRRANRAAIAARSGSRP